jgi:PAS domain S-box-containing protein
MEIAGSYAGILQQKIDDQQAEILRLKNELNQLKSSYTLAERYLGGDGEAGKPETQSVFRLSATISSLNEGILLEDEHRKIVLTNDAFCSLFNIPASPEQMIGADCSDSAEQSKLYFKDECGFVNRIEKLLKNRETVVGDLLELKDGRVFMRDFIAINIAGNYIGHLWKYRDVTEQKKTEVAIKAREEKYRGIIQNMNLGLLEVDNDERIMFANQSFCQITGYAPDELIGKIASSLFLDNSADASMEEKNNLRKKGISDAYDIRIKDKYGNYKWMMISGAPLYDDRRKLIGSIGIHLDITEQKKLENELIKSKKVAEESSKAKELFLANMSHEIRTPMNAILGMSRLLTKTTQNSQQKTYTNAIIQSAENLIVIINDILDLSKIDAGQMQIESIGFSLADLVSQLERILKYKTEEKGLEFNTASSVHIPQVLTGDPYRINQVLLNLVGNAIKFTETGSVELWCKLGESKNGMNTIVFTVKDTGIGIDPEYLKHLYKDFSQEDASITRKFGGTGLGLSISKKLINLMGGEMAIESTKGEGTVISFSLNLPTGKSDALVREVADPVELKEHHRELINKKILLVEDNDFNRLLATTILTTYGAVITEAWNGKVAIDMAAEQNFDLIIMDIQMPVMNGFEATRYIRQTLHSSIPILALTANAVKGEKSKCIDAGMDEYIAKPFEETHLVKTICNMLKQSAGKFIPEEKTGEKGTVNDDQLYSIVTLKETAGADDAFIKQMLNTFIRQGKECLGSIDEAVQNRDMDSMQAIVHKMKPSINYLKMKDMGAMIRGIQVWEKGFNNSFEDMTDNLRKKLEATITKMEADLPAMFGD